MNPHLDIFRSLLLLFLMAVSANAYAADAGVNAQIEIPEGPPAEIEEPVIVAPTSSGTDGAWVPRVLGQAQADIPLLESLLPITTPGDPTAPTPDASFEAFIQLIQDAGVLIEPILIEAENGVLIEPALVLPEVVTKLPLTKRRRQVIIEYLESSVPKRILTFLELEKVMVSPEKSGELGVLHHFYLHRFNQEELPAMAETVYTLIAPNGESVVEEFEFEITGLVTTVRVPFFLNRFTDLGDFRIYATTKIGEHSDLSELQFNVERDAFDNVIGLPRDQLLQASLPTYPIDLTYIIAAALFTAVFGGMMYFGGRGEDFPAGL